MLFAPAAAFGLSLATLLVLLRFPELLVDQPNQRSLHVVPVPRTGGIAIVKDEEIIEIKKFMSEYDDVEIRAIDVNPADEVMVNAGVMMGASGRVIRTMGNNIVEVRIDSLGFILTARFARKNVIKL